MQMMWLLMPSSSSDLQLTLGLFVAKCKEAKRKLLNHFLIHLKKNDWTRLKYTVSYQVGVFYKITGST